MPGSKEEQARDSLYIQREHRTAPLFVVVDLEGELARRRDKKIDAKEKGKSGSVPTSCWVRSGQASCYSVHTYARRSAIHSESFIYVTVAK